MKRVLILEDEWELASVWQAALEKLGYCVNHEVSVDRALEAIAAFSFDLIITDILIRDSDNKIGSKGGLSLLSHLALNVNPRPKTIAVSGASPQIRVLDHAALLKADRTLNKPVTAEEISAAVRELLEE